MTATRGPSDRDLETICEAVKEIKNGLGLRVCTSLGILKDGDAEKLKEAGVDRFNHNVETSERNFSNVATTHSWQDRVDTLRKVRSAGIEACCGGIIGMGETLDDIVDMAFSLRELDVESVPVNFLDPRPGTPDEDRPVQDPDFCLRVLAMFRFILPERDIRVAGGREVNLRERQPLALKAVNSMFTEGYLTTGGNAHEQDLRMIREAGFEVVR